MLFGLSLLLGCSFSVQGRRRRRSPMTLVLCARHGIAAAIVLGRHVLLARNRPALLTEASGGCSSSCPPSTMRFLDAEFLGPAIHSERSPPFSTRRRRLCFGRGRGIFMLADEKLKANRLAGVVVGFISVAILIRSPALLDREPFPGRTWRCWRGCQLRLFRRVRPPIRDMGVSATQSARRPDDRRGIHHGAAGAGHRTRPWNVSMPTTVTQMAGGARSRASFRRPPPTCCFPDSRPARPTSCW